MHSAPDQRLSDQQRAETVWPPGPLYQRVKDHICRQIQDGALPPDARVPSEIELVKSFGISRMTVNRAMRELTAAGILTRIPGVGTFVAPPQIRTELLEIRNIADEIRSRGHHHTCRVDTAETQAAPAVVAQALQVPAATPVFHTLLVHYENNIAIQVEDRYVNPAIAPDYLQADFTTITPNQYLVDLAPITEGEHVLEAVLADERTRRLLGIKPSEPCLRLSRRTWSQDRVVTCAWLTHPGALYRMGARFPVGGGVTSPGRSTR
jgi:GntR family histidine utilization transcriptional repressor